jgi:hypothetical protein
VHVQLAKVTAEVHVLLDAELLIAEEDHQTIHERIMHFLELLIARAVWTGQTPKISAPMLGVDLRNSMVW